MKKEPEMRKTLSIPELELINKNMELVNKHIEDLKTAVVDVENEKDVEVNRLIVKTTRSRITTLLDEIHDTFE